MTVLILLALLTAAWHPRLVGLFEAIPKLTNLTQIDTKNSQWLGKQHCRTSEGLSYINLDMLIN